jgi:hypothetical protein
LREALDVSRDLEVAELLTDRQEVRRITCDLLQSDFYGGPIKRSRPRLTPRIELLIRVDERLTQRLAEARARGSSESVDIWAARRIVRAILAEVVEEWKHETEHLEELGT